MGWLARLMGLEERTGPIDPQTDYPDIDAQLLALQRSGRDTVSPPTIKDALGVPAVLRAVTLISTAIATLDLKTYRSEVEEDPIPLFVRRPARQWRSFDFWRDSSFYMSTRGEAIWLTIERNAEGFPSSIVPVVPESLQSEWDGVDHSWWSMTGSRKTPIPARDVTHITILRDPVTGRGMGPLQLCGAALTVADEANRWAARFFSGSGIPSVFLNVESSLSPDEADALKLAWLRDPPNMPKIGHGLTPTVMQTNPEQGQLVESRLNNRAEVALMFGISGRLLEYAASGSSITYANVGDLATELLRLTLAPYYLEPMEQAFSDLLPRGTEARFDVAGLQRADPKTRYDIYEKGIGMQLYGPEYVRLVEGIPDEAAPEAAAVTPQPLRAVANG